MGQADDGAQALEIVRKHHPNVLLLDLNMPGTSGLDVLPQIRAEWPDIKVLVLTGRDEDAYIVRALRAGAHGYILKTTDEKDLLQAVLDVYAGHLVLGHGVAERVVQGLMTQGEGQANRLSDLDRTILNRCCCRADQRPDRGTHPHRSAACRRAAHHVDRAA